MKRVLCMLIVAVSSVVHAQSDTDMNWTEMGPLHVVSGMRNQSYYAPETIVRDHGTIIVWEKLVIFGKKSTNDMISLRRYKIDCRSLQSAVLSARAGFGDNISAVDSGKEETSSFHTYSPNSIGMKNNQFICSLER